MTSLLGGMSPSTFLRRCWQKRPLLVRQAFPGFRGFVDRDGLLALAERDDAVSRLVVEHPRRARDRWERHDGPFGGLDASMLPRTHWTLLVHGVESLLPGGWELLGAFPFIPAARIDDLMVSFAADGGSVGPHDDLYDVFLLQGPGRRRWRISRGGDRTHDPTAAIKVLRSFVPEEEWLLEPGDLLYLPPGVAHHGVAEGPCFTYSIGFLAPSHRTLVEEFLGYLAHELGGAVDPAAIYQDPDLSPPRDPFEIGDVLVRRIAGVLGRIRWGPAQVEDFVGRFLTRPKPHIRFAAPARPLSPEAFASRLRRPGRLALALPSRGLIRRNRLYLNGESYPASRAGRGLFGELLRARQAALPLRVDRRTAALLHAWYQAGHALFR